MLQRLLHRLLGPPRTPIRRLGELGEFMGAQAAFVSQKATIDYLRARAGLAWPQLFREKDFREALDYCRWEAYAAVLQDVAELAQIFLRRAGAPEAPLPAVLADLVELALGAYPVPAHRDDWTDVVAATRDRLERALLVPPRPVRLVGYESARRIFPIMPIHTNLARYDREVVENNIRFLLVGVYSELEQRAVVAALLEPLRAAAALDGTPPPPTPPSTTRQSSREAGP